MSQINWETKPLPDSNPKYFGYYEKIFLVVMFGKQFSGDFDAMIIPFPYQLH